MSAALKYDLVSPEEYLASEIDSPLKREYVAGVIHAMTGATNTHNRIARNILIALSRRLEGGPCQAVNSDTKIRIRKGHDCRFYYPDVSVVCEENPGEDHFEDCPTVIVEVLSPSTRRIDLSEKREAYLTIPSMQSYLLVEQDQPAIVHYRRTLTGFVREFAAGLATSLEISGPPLTLPLAEVYDRIEFSVESTA